MRDEFATVQEVNTELTNYFQIKDLPPTVDMSDYALKSDIPIILDTSDLTNYRMKDDLTYSTIKNKKY